MDPQAKVITVWVAYAIGILVTGTPFVGVILAYIFRRSTDHPGFAGHSAAQIRSFWWAFLGWMIAFAMIAAGFVLGLSVDDATGEAWFIGILFAGLGLIVGIIVQIAFTIYAIIGIVRASKRKNWPGAEPTQNTSAVFG